MRLHGQAVKTSPFHGGNPGSIPGGVTKKKAPELGCFFSCLLPTGNGRARAFTLDTQILLRDAFVLEELCDSHALTADILRDFLSQSPGGVTPFFVPSFFGDPTVHLTRV